MPSQAIKSLVIASVSYDSKQLTIYFKSGSRFRYYGVPMKMIMELCKPSTNAGTYYVTQIKKKYAAVKLNKNQA